MLFHVLGKCNQIHNPNEFKDVDLTMKFTVAKTILSNHNHMLFGDKQN
jgi:hypothetical protein